MFEDTNQDSYQNNCPDDDQNGIQNSSQADCQGSDPSSEYSQETCAPADLGQQEQTGELTEQGQTGEPYDTASSYGFVLVEEAEPTATTDPAANSTADMQETADRTDGSGAGTTADATAKIDGAAYGAAPGNGRKAAKKKTAGNGKKKIVALALCCSLVGGAVGAGGMAVGMNTFGDSNQTTVQEGQRQTEAVNVAHVDTSKEMTASEIYAQNVNSTVGITTSVTTNYFGYETTSAASGSGFILTEDGYIVTNYHVIEGASDITVTMYDDTSYEASVVGYDESNDLAVLKIEATGLTPVVLGDSDQMNVGDEVLAIGNPLGELTFSLTAGAISALDREITTNNTEMNLIQTDCAINAGNSGGALFNMYGEVIGITNAKYSGSGSSSEASIDNIGFAIPINSVKDIITSIIEKGYITTPYIGVYITDLDSQYQNYGVPEGAVVQGVKENSPAENAGLQANDIITEVDGEAVTSSSELKSAISKHEAGDVLTLTVYRQGETLTIKVKVAEQQQAVNMEESESSNGSGSSGSAGGSQQWGPSGESQQGRPEDGTEGMPDLGDIFGR